MALFTACDTGDLSEVCRWEESVAGAELNVAIGLNRLGHDARYLCKVGRDPFGFRVLDVMRTEHLDTSMVTLDHSHHTGFMMKSKVTHGDPLTFYMRANSAASTLSSADVSQADWNGVTLMHLTGILPALSETTKDASQTLIDEARERGVFVSFDPNLRPALWPSRDQMRTTLLHLAAQADLVFPGIAEGRELFGADTEEDVAEAFLDNGAKTVIVKNGAQGALIANRNWMKHIAGFHVDSVVDTVGAGDGFAAGVLSALLEGRDLSEAVKRGCAIGAVQTQFVSDNAGLPNPAELKRFMSTHERTGIAHHLSRSSQPA
ncbi:sugar kinase [Bifidobacterium canis]|uniref:2-dehydro-3-deoxygluconokinase n=1 Tax=Bifidobacterium canis TaxID=2610880 RepID=A0A7K1J2N4_9BIFI|nr:sugar kinase [Bifidobacterium canis]MUH58897.1 2-dehydro-3-deoxygluconokinase [Bifidobacterium canis]